MTKRWSILIVALVLVVAAGCTGDDDDGDNGSEVRGENSPSPEASIPDAATELGISATEYQEYLDLIDLAVSDIEGYWIAKMPGLFGIEYQPPAQLIPYSAREDAPTCAGESVGVENAVYCSTSDYIAWDEAGLLLPYYTEIGDFAVAYVLAHEYGHSVQKQVGSTAQANIAFELQADCYAGSWAGDADTRGLLEEGDLEEGITALYTLGDLKGTHWADPDAHGTAKERIDTFEFGFRSGARKCARGTAQ
jgi:predicted metalloprotease